VKAGALLERSDKPGEVGVRGDSLHQKMKMIGHEAVRNYDKVFVVRGSQKLPDHEVHRTAGLEHPSADVRADCEQIPITAGVIEYG
jgi:hypothetical protein